MVYNDNDNDNHNNIISSNIWIEHYKQFVQFIISSKYIDKQENILEIGAGNNYIANLLIENGFDNYVVLEPNITEKIDNIEYIQGWLCDLPKNNKYNLTILSHVFEHLYTPKDLFDVNTEYIAISIPNIPDYIENNIVNFLNIEHTFYFEEKHIENFFSKNNYSIVSHEYFGKHSIFYLFKKHEKKYIKQELNKDLIDIKFKKYFINLNSIVSKINEHVEINKNTNFVVFPANMYIQYLITLGLDISNIKYYYDNNINKLDKYLYGTNIICKNLQYFIDNNNYTIILLGFLYNEEIIKLLDENNIKYYSPI